MSPQLKASSTHACRPARARPPSRWGPSASRATRMRTRRLELRAHRRTLRRMSALHPYDLSMPILEVADVRLNYFVAGEGTPVTLLHGFTLSGSTSPERIRALP